MAASILEGLDEILTVVRLKLPMELRRSLACTNIAENMMGTIRRVTRNVKRWRSGTMALRMGRRRHDRSGERLPQAEGASTAAAPPLRPDRTGRSASPKARLPQHQGPHNVQSGNAAR